MRGKGAEAFEFVYKSQLQCVCLATVICFPPSLPLCLPQDLSQNGACRLGGKEGFIKWWVVTGWAELKNWAGGGRGGRF